MKPLLVFAISLAACASSPPVENGDAASDAGTDAVADGCASTPTFAQVYEATLAGCGGKIACHTRAPYGGGLNLSTIDAARSGMLASAQAMAGTRRVAPGDVAHSMLWRKLTNDLPSDDSAGRAMPITMLATGWNRLSDERLEVLRCWIGGGAPLR